MASKRKAIRNATAAAINFTGVNVYKHRKLPANVDLLPLVNVLTLGDTVNRDPKVKDFQNRKERIVLIVQDKGLEEHENPAAGIDAVIDKLDNLIEDLELIFTKSLQTLSGLIFRLNYVSTEIELNVDGEHVIGTAAVTYEAEYLENLV